MRDQYDRFHERVRIEYGPKGRIAQLVMENSDMPISVFSSSMVDAMTEAVETVDGDIGCLILCGEDEFSAGADLRDMRNAPTEMRSAKIDAIAASSNRFIRALRSLSAPVIAAVTGVAAGGGLGFALACDLVMMHMDAVLDTAYARIGLTSDNATPFSLRWRSVPIERGNCCSIPADPRERSGRSRAGDRRLRLCRGRLHLRRA